MPTEKSKKTQRKQQKRRPNEARSGGPAGGVCPSVRNVLDSAGCQSYQCPSLGTCAFVFPQSGVSESARSCVWFGFASFEASMASRRTIFRRAWFFPAGSAKADLRAQLSRPGRRVTRRRLVPSINSIKERGTGACSTPLTNSAGRCSGVAGHRATGDFRWCSSMVEHLFCKQAVRGSIPLPSSDRA
jgi:hypothetical protein